MTTWFDAPTFAAALRAKRGERSLREISTEIGTVNFAIKPVESF
jgi:hypothetical protein